MQWVNRWRLGLQGLALPVVRPAIVGSIAHDPRAFTQGLAYAEGALYESTGTWEASSLRRLDPDTGAVLEQLPVEGDFAEGIACLGERIHQLTWTSGRVLIYARNPLRLVGEGRIGHEGWGLAADAGELVATDGSHRLRRYDPELKLTREIAIRRLGLPFRHLNALAVVRGQAYINIWYTPLIARVDLASGRLAGFVDCSEAVSIESPASPHHILNGIAYLPDRGSFMITGKFWRNMFEIRLET